MKSKFLKWGLSGVLACTVLGTGAQQINPMMEAVLQNYADILAQNPRDYQTLYDRATQYMELGDYVRALSDIDMALDCTPASDSDYRLAEYSLKGDIMTAQKNYAGAIEATNAALAISPTSQADLYKLGNLYLLTNQPADALKAFQSLQRENSRSQEAFYGMAKAQAMLGNTLEAENLIKEVEALGKQSFITYCRIGDLYSDMGNVKEATTNYVIAYTMTDDSQRPLSSLKLLMKKNPNLVLETLEGIIASKPDNVALNYIEAILAYDAGMYAVAEKACKELASKLEEDSPAVYRMMALSQLALNKTSEAKDAIGVAERLAPGATGMLLDKAEVFLIQDPQVAWEAASQAVSQSSNDELALISGAKAGMMAGKYPEAMNYLNEVVLSNPSNGEALLLRGYLNEEYLNDGKAAVGDYTRAGNIHQSGAVSDLIFAALGKAKSGKKLDSDGMIAEAVQKAGNDKDLLYLIAVYYAQTGNLEKAKEFADKAVANGYANVYNLKTNTEPLFNLAPIHHLM